MFFLEDSIEMAEVAEAHIVSDIGYVHLGIVQQGHRPFQTVFHNQLNGRQVHQGLDFALH